MTENVCSHIIEAQDLTIPKKKIEACFSWDKKIPLNISLDKISEPRRFNPTRSQAYQSPDWTAAIPFVWSKLNVEFNLDLLLNHALKFILSSLF